MKINRHAKIVELINKYHIETQEELAEYLNREGFKVTQATVSRDIRDLKLTKVPPLFRMKTRNLSHLGIMLVSEHRINTPLDIGQSLTSLKRRTRNSMFSSWQIVN